MFVAQADAGAVFGIVAQADIEFLARHFAHRHQQRHAVVHHFGEIGFHLRAAVVAVLFQRLLVIQDFVEIVGFAGLKLRHAGNHRGGITLVAAHLDIAEIHRLFAVYAHGEHGLAGLRVDGGTAFGERGQRVFIAAHGGEHRVFAAAPLAVHKRLAHRQGPVGHGAFVVGGQIGIFQHFAHNRHFHIAHLRARPGLHRDAPAAAVRGYLNIGAEIALRAHDLFDFVRRFFGQKLHLFLVDVGIRLGLAVDDGKMLAQKRGQIGRRINGNGERQFVRIGRGGLLNRFFFFAFLHRIGGRLPCLAVGTGGQAQQQGGNHGKGEQRGFHGQSAIGKHQAGVWRQTAAY